MSRIQRIRLTTLLAFVALASQWARAEPFGFVVPLEERESGHYYVHGALGEGVETDFLVDTGSGYVALSKETFDRVRHRPGTKHLRDIVGAMANGKLMKVPIYRLAELTISDDCHLQDVEVAVFPAGSRDILGLSVLRRVEPFAMHMSPPMLRVSTCEKSLQASADS